MISGNLDGFNMGNVCVEIRVAQMLKMFMKGQ